MERSAFLERQEMVVLRRLPSSRAAVLLKAVNHLKPVRVSFTTLTYSGGDCIEGHRVFKRHTHK